MREREMVEKLTNLIRQHAMQDNITLSAGPVYPFGCELLALRILDLLSREGMSPPLEPGRRIEDCDLGLPQWEE